MNRNSPALSNWLRFGFIALLTIGIIFRFVNVSHKVYWHDEVYTSIRAAGYTRTEVDQTLFRGVTAAGELQRFQQMKPGSTALDTVRSLAAEDPHHPPLYFLMARYWMHAFGPSITASRLLAVFISLLALPATYFLAQELFASHTIALVATTLLALSPFDVLFAQTARQYSLLTLMTITSQWLLLRAIRATSSSLQSHRYGKPLSSRENRSSSYPWLLYALSITIGLYTIPLFSLVIATQAAYVGVEWLLGRANTTLGKGSLWRFGAAVVATLLLFLPWVAVLAANWQQAAAVTDWTKGFSGFDVALKYWTLSFTALFFDLDFGFNNPITFLLRLPILLLIGFSCYALVRQTPRSTWLPVLTLIWVPFLLLAIPDIAGGNHRSFVSRYLIPCFPGVQLTVAYLITTKLAARTQYFWRSSVLNLSTVKQVKMLLPVVARRLWSGGFALLIVGCLASLTASAASFTWWCKDTSYFNQETARLINRQPSPIVLTDLGNYQTNTGDLISLSYLLKPEVPLLLVENPEQARTPAVRSRLVNKQAMSFRPSGPLKQVLDQTYGTLVRVHPTDLLWEIPPVQTQ